MIDHSNHPPHDPDSGNDANPPPRRISRTDNAILMVLSESPTFLACEEIVAATGDYPLPYRITVAKARRRLPHLHRHGLVEYVRRDGGFKITARGETVKHAI